jgi:phenylacetate-CoA ligase
MQTLKKYTSALTDTFLTLRGIHYYKHFLSNSDRLPPNTINSRQEKLLNKLLLYCAKNIPWYIHKFRESGITPGAENPFRELAKLPILSKSDVRINHSQLMPSNSGMLSLKFSTSGTTGEPLDVHTSHNQWVVEQACIWRQWKWAGYNFRDRIATFRSYAPKVGESKIKVDHLRNWAFFSVFDMDDASIEEYARFLSVWKPRFLRGYPSALLLLAQHALIHGWKLPGVVAAFSASEVVSVEARDAVRKAFGIEIFDHYGQAEITCMFHDCEKHEGMHLDWEYGLVELLPTDEHGLYRIVATNLHNMAMPLLRYDTGDLAVGNWTTCSCGRSTPVIRSIRGRMDDYVIFANGSRISTVNLYTFFSKFSEIRKYQVIQNSPGQINVNIQCWHHRIKSFEEKSFFNMISKKLSDMTNLSVTIDSHLPFLQSREGKSPAFIQNIKK